MANNRPDKEADGSNRQEPGLVSPEAFEDRETPVGSDILRELFSGKASQSQSRFWDRLDPIIDRLMRIGISGYDRETRRRLSIVNLAGYLSAISSLSYAANFALYNASALKWLIVGNLVSALVTATAPFWHRFNSLASPFVLTTIVGVTLFFFVSELGRDSGVQLNYIGSVAIAFVIFGIGHLRIVAGVTVFCVIAHVACVFLFETGRVQWAISDAFMAQLYFLSAASIMLILALIVWYAFSIAADAEARIARLLHNTLPQVIAERLEEDSSVRIADRFDEASVLFCDLAGFTRLSLNTDPDRLLALLDEIFSEFDRAGDRFQVEKIKTIGDAYMAVAGVPVPDEQHEIKIMELAIEMQKALDRVAKAYNLDLKIRTGIASGPITAGVIGKTKFSYDVWAPTVNLASRLESHGTIGRIRVSDPVKRAVEHLHEFEPAPMEELKGIGATKSWYWVRRR